MRLARIVLLVLALIFALVAVWVAFPEALFFDLTVEGSPAHINRVICGWASLAFASYVLATLVVEK
jgi:hypothetical protein